MAINNPDTPLSAAEIQELRRLIADRQRFGRRADPLVATLIGVFAAGFLGFIGWLGYATTENGKDIVALREDVAALQTGQKELKADMAGVKASIAELKAGQGELKAILLELRRR